MQLPKGRIPRAANALIVDNVESYRHAAKAKRRADEQARNDQERKSATGSTKEPGYSREFHAPDRAARALQMQMDRASGALDALHKLFPDLPAWTETKWIH